MSVRDFSHTKVSEGILLVTYAGKVAKQTYCAAEQTQAAIAHAVRPTVVWKGSCVGLAENLGDSRRLMWVSACWLVGPM